MFCSNPELFTEHLNCVCNLSCNIVFLMPRVKNTGFGRCCNTMPKDALILQFQSRLPASGKEAKPKEFNQDGR